jgi:ribosome-binding protein aMBF1 (putative translation factor)
MASGHEMLTGRTCIPVSELTARWRNDPAFVLAYDALELSFAIIGARSQAGFTQEQLAEKMGTTRAVVARLENGRITPSMRTLERVAEATGLKLKISFEPALEPSKSKKRAKAA